MDGKQFGHWSTPFLDVLVEPENSEVSFSEEKYPQDVGEHVLRERRATSRALCNSHLLSSKQDFRLWFEYELRITDLTHLRNIQSGNFSLDRDSLPENDVQHPVEYEAEAEDEANQRSDADQLRNQLAGVAVEQARD